MTYMAINLISILFAASHALALKPAASVPAADVKHIQDLINKAASIQVDINIAKNALMAAEIASRNKPNDPVLSSNVAHYRQVLGACPSNTAASIRREEGSFWEDNGMAPAAPGFSLSRKPGRVVSLGSGEVMPSVSNVGSVGDKRR